MFTFRQPVNPSVNAPQAIVDFVGLLKDPAWLKSLVEASQSIAGANKLTEEEAENVRDARAALEKASGLDKAYKSREDRITAREVAVLDREAGAAAREKQCDGRNTAIAKQEADAAARQAALDKSAKDVGDLWARALAKEKANATEALRLASWASSLEDEQKQWDAARNLVTKKKANG